METRNITATKPLVKVTVKKTFFVSIEDATERAQSSTKNFTEKNCATTKTVCCLMEIFREFDWQHLQIKCPLFRGIF